MLKVRDMRNLLLSTTAAVTFAAAATAQEGGQLQAAIEGGIQMMNAQGANITYDSREVASDNSLIFNGFRMAPEDDVDLEISTDWLRFSPSADMEGGVTVTVAPMINVSVNDDEISFDIVVESENFALTSNTFMGDMEAPRMTLAADSISARNPDPDDPMIERMDIRLDDLDFSFELDTASGDSDAALSAANMLIDMKVADPDGPVLYDQRSETESVSMTFTGSNLPVGGDDEDVIAFFGEDGSFRLRVESGAGTSSMGATRDLPVAIEGEGVGGSMEASLQDGILAYSTNLGAVSYVVTPDPNVLPLPPMDASLAALDLDLRTPVRPSESLQEAKFLLNLSELTVSDSAWSLIDPAGSIPRDPATLQIDLTSMMRLLVPLGQIQDTDSPTQAVEVDSVDIKRVHMDAAGAEVDADGSLAIDNSGPIPFPNGSIDISVRGAQTLAEKLVNLGLVDEMQVGMVMGMLMAFAEQGDGPDHFTSTIEFKDGGVFANGQPIQ